jgi:hypothetical protein
MQGGRAMTAPHGQTQRSRIRAELRRQAAFALRRLDPSYFASDLVTGRAPTDDLEPVIAFAKREHAKLIRHLLEGKAIGPLTGRGR